MRWVAAQAVHVMAVGGGSVFGGGNAENLGEQ